jgi:Flp pilus assembly protein TadD
MLPDAIQEYRRALALFPKMPDVQIALGKLYLRSGQTDKAQREFEDLTRGSTEIPEANTWLGIVYYKLGRREDARRQWEKAQTVQPSNPAAKAYMKLARDWTT